MCAPFSSNDPFADISMGSTLKSVCTSDRYDVQPLPGEFYPVRSTNFRQALYRVIDDALSPADLEMMKFHIAYHPLVLSAPVLQTKTISEVKGFTFYFSKKGFRENQDELSFLQPFIDNVIDDEANYFSLLVVLVHPNITTIERKNESPPGVSVHHDMDIVFNEYGPMTEFVMPHTTSALYLNVPPRIIGGKLTLWQWELDDFLGMRHCTSHAPAARLKPRNNRIVQFRGDAPHGVEPFWVIEDVHQIQPDEHPHMAYFNSRRVSLVLQQYRLEPDRLLRAPEFHIETGNENEIIDYTTLKKMRDYPGYQ